MTVDRKTLTQVCSNAALADVQTSLAEFLKDNGTIGSLEFASRKVREVSERELLKQQKIAFLSSFTLEPISAALTISEFEENRAIKPAYWPYNQWQQVLNIEGELDLFSPDVIYLSLQLEDVLPKLSRTHVASINELDLELSTFLAEMERAISAYRKRSQTPIFIANFISMSRGIERCFDRNSPKGRQERIDLLNGELTNIAGKLESVHIFDYAGLVTDYGRNNWFDTVRHYQIGTNIQAKKLPVLAQEITRYLSAQQRPRKKVLALDLDNTLWKGILGEDGLDGIAYDGPYPGNLYSNFQATISNLRASGVALALLSKNNLSDAKEAFETCHGMTLKWDDFASHQVNWNEKGANIHIAASEINVGVNSFVFIDDNPLELDLMRELAPDVTVVDFDGDGSRLPQILQNITGFDILSLTADEL